MLEPFVADPQNANVGHQISLERLTLASTQIATGCAEFAVRSAGVHYAAIST